MSVANKLYDRSHGFVGDVSASNPPMLYVDGTLPDVPTGDAYEGRLQIHNNVGPCKVALLSGNLPNGYRLRVDNTTFQVVLSWPSYGVDVVGIDNAGFGSGNDGSWDLGPGWSITNTGPTDPNDPLNTNEAKYADSYGLADITNNRYVPVTTGQSITANCDMNLGGSRSDGRILLKWYDSNRNYVSPSLGDELSDNGTWQRPSVTGSAPQDGFVRISAHVNREHDNKPCWVDNFTWNYVQGSQGTNTSGSIPLSIRVTDSLGRIADWGGIISIIGGVSIIANLPFNTSVDEDTTGRIWAVTPFTSTNGKTYPFLSAAGAKEGLASLWSEAGTTANQNRTHPQMTSIIGGNGIPKGIDYCVEGFISVNCFPSDYFNNNATPFDFGSTMTPLVRVGSYHNPSYGNYYYFSTFDDPSVFYPVDSALDLRLIPGVVYHWAITRSGLINNIWWNGKLAYTKADSNVDVLPTRKFYIGQTGDAPVSGWFVLPGSLDDIRVTLGWARYTVPFTSPTPPY